MATTNMGLTLPVVSVTLGPQWATELNAALTLVDAHDHTSNKGKAIPTAGLNINADLPFANNSATLLKSVQLSNNASTLATERSIYASGGDLWFTDASSNAIRITIGGAVNAGPGSISGLTGTASASYNSGSQTFSWRRTSSLLASMQMGAVVLHASTDPSLNSLSIEAPAALSAAYTITLPDALPAAGGGFLMMRSTGAQEYAYPDNSTIEESSGTIRIKDNGVSTAKIQDDSVTPRKVRNTNTLDYYFNLTGSTLNIIGNTTAWTTIATISGWVIESGFLKVCVEGIDGISTLEILAQNLSTSTQMTSEIRIVFAGPTARTFAFKHTTAKAISVGNASFSNIPPPFVFDNFSAGTYTVTLEARVTSTSTDHNLGFSRLSLAAFQL